MAPTLSPVEDNRRGIARDDDDVFEWVDDDEIDADERPHRSRELGFLNWDDDDYRDTTRITDLRRRSGSAFRRERYSGKSRKSSKSGKSTRCFSRRPRRPRQRRPSNERFNKRPTNGRPR